MSVVAVLVVVPGTLLFGLFGLLGSLAATVKEKGQKCRRCMKPPIGKSADRARDWAMLAAWDAADNRFELPVRTEADIYAQLLADELDRRQRKADEECARI